MNLFLVRIGLSMAGLALIFASGYMAGRQHGREASLKAAVTAHQSREKINEDVQNLDPVALCRAVGGVQHDCAALLRGFHKTTTGQ